jgi:hypothetical protein
MNRSLVLLVTVVIMLAAQMAAAAETAQKYGHQPDSFEIKYYAQPRFEAELNGDSEVTNSFLVRRARIYLTSTISPNVTGRVQVNALPDKVVLLEAYFHWKPFVAVPAFTFRGGMLKKPFGYQEYVLSSSTLNMIDRTVTNTLLEKELYATAEDIGAAAYADFWEYDIPLTVHAGVFNGERKGAKSDSNSGKEFVARAEAVPLTGLTVGANGVVNRVGPKDDAETYFIWGGDVRYAKRGFLVAFEAMGGDNYAGVMSAPVADVPGFLGVYIEGIYRARSGWEPGFRVERFDPDTDTDDNGRLLVTGQIAKSMSPNFRWQINVIHTEFEADGVDSEDELVSQWTVRL